MLSGIKIIDRKRIEDERGWFMKVMNGLEENLPGYTGEVYLTNAKPNEAKGGHYHPLANEWFTLVSGKCELKLVTINTNEKQTILLDSAIPQTVYVPANVAHIFINGTNSEFILLAYSDQLYKAEDTIMFSDF